MLAIIELLIIIALSLWLGKLFTAFALVVSSMLGGFVRKSFKIKSERYNWLFSFGMGCVYLLFSLILPLWAICFFLAVEFGWGWADSVTLFTSHAWYWLLSVGFFATFFGSIFLDKESS